MASISPLGFTFDVTQALRELDAAPELWNEHRQRLNGPHTDVSDIWVRYRPWNEYDGNPVFFNQPHKSEWYAGAAKIPAVRELAEQMFHLVSGAELGGVLITLIPAGGEVKPHVDGGWHAEYYRKFAIQLKGNEKQAFCFEDSRLSAEPGESYEFDNSKLHWVTNDSDEERMTLIVCVRT